MKFAGGAKLGSSRAEFFALAARPEAEVEDDIDAERQQSRRQIPHDRFDRIARRIEGGVRYIKAEKLLDPLVRRQSHRAALGLDLLGERRFPRTGEAAHEVKGGHDADLVFARLPAYDWTKAVAIR